MKYKIKIVLGFRPDQHHSIDADEAHKAYYLFLHPEKRGIFKNGLAIRGSDIQNITPDYLGTMEWNSNHTLTTDDMNEIRGRGVDIKLREIMNQAREIAQKATPEILEKPLSEMIKSLPEVKISEEAKQLSNKMRV